MPSSKLRLEFFKSNPSDTSMDAFTHWVQFKYDEQSARIKELEEGITLRDSMMKEGIALRDSMIEDGLKKIKELKGWVKEAGHHKGCRYRVTGEPDCTCGRTTY